jgi:TRAP-type C4-dicarboxylate transport system permease small subunit
MATNLLVFTIFFGAAAAELQREQITVTVIRDRIVGVIGPSYRIFLYLLTLGFAGAVIYGSYFQMLDGWSRQGAVIHWFRAGYLFGFLMVAFVIIFITLLTRMIFIIRREVSGGAE